MAHGEKVSIGRRQELAGRVVTLKLKPLIRKNYTKASTLRMRRTGRPCLPRSAVCFPQIPAGQAYRLIGGLSIMLSQAERPEIFNPRRISAALQSVPRIKSAKFGDDSGALRQKAATGKQAAFCRAVLQSCSALRNRRRKNSNSPEG